ncbi:tubulin epsilon and delta complex protein 2 isoform X2 [Callithrix jacchus]|uniref:tubulin epsilon and delta complex protein 2 isoform X2 n=1 Tax=Callithrix jacchus TaxID=9483 RepID=UPI0023DCF435|nr:tubulin epsilon and delta complex protein 2 isoform X2 [Callithrix jacchus]
MLPRECSRRLVAELQGALDACAERQLQLEQSLRVCRRLLQAWEPTGTRALEPPPGPETKEEDPPPACTPSPQDLKELEFLTQALEKAVRVRRGIAKAGKTDKAPSLKSRSTVTPPGTIAFAPPQTPGRAGGHASDLRPTKGPCQTTVPAKGHSECQLLSLGDKTRVRTGAQAPRPGPGLRNQQMAPSAAPQAPKVFTLKEKGLWAQLRSMQTTDTAAAKTRFLQNMQTASGGPQPRLSTEEVEAETGRLWKACSLLRLRMREELSAAPTDWMQEYRCLLTLEGLQAMVGQCLHRLQELRAVFQSEDTSFVKRKASLTKVMLKHGKESPPQPEGPPQRTSYHGSRTATKTMSCGEAPQNLAILWGWNRSCMEPPAACLLQHPGAADPGSPQASSGHAGTADPLGKGYSRAPQAAGAADSLEAPSHCDCPLRGFPQQGGPYPALFHWLTWFNPHACWMCAPGGQARCPPPPRPGPDDPPIPGPTQGTVASWSRGVAGIALWGP